MTARSCGCADATRGQRVDEQDRSRFTGTRRPTATTSGIGERVPPGENRRIDTRRHDVDPCRPRSRAARRARASTTPTSVTIGVRRYSGGATRNSMRAPEPREARRQRHLPHRVVHVVQPRDARAPRPQRREERHAVPDLDEPVARAVPTHHLAERGPREHHVAPGLADHPVAVAPGRPAAGRARTTCAS